ncbi:MAG: alpha/beta hydrolase family protein [Marinicellaceae bacterium]
MRKYLLLIFFSTLIQAQEVTGDWHGKLEVMGTQLRLSFHVSQSDGVYTSTMDSPDQGAMGIATTSTTFEKGILVIVMESIGAQYEGELSNDELTGTFSQRGMNFPLKLSKHEVAKPEKVIRPQDPIKPYKYISEDITFVNKSADSIKLAGTLTLPHDIKNPPVAVLISGSGPQNRDEELGPFNHRPFLVLSDHLTKKGIAVLRFDDRGVAESEGDHTTATSADFATDVSAALDYLKTRDDINHSKIGLIGHSEGGFIAPMVVSQRNDIAFIVMLAGTGVDGAKILLTQGRRAAELEGASLEKLDFNEKVSHDIFDLVKLETNTEALKLQLSEYLDNLIKTSPKELTKDFTDDVIKSQINTLSSEWFQYFIRTDPAQFLSQVKIPVLAINGEKDFQVLPDLNLQAIDKILKKAGNKDYTTQRLAGMNHLFQVAETGAISEYGTIEETFSPIALKVVSDWINARF